MRIDTRTISLWDTLRLQLVVAVPAFLWGLVAPNRFFVACLCRWNAGQWTVRLLGELREKYQCDHLWAWFPSKRTLLVLNQKSIDAVLRSNENAADPALKKRALSGFVPDALIISSGGEWADRRSFNESALDLGRLHRHADAFRDIAYQEIASLPVEHGRDLRWADFESLAQRISHQVVLGAGQLNPEMAMHLARLVKRSNWAFLPRPRRNFSAFYQQVEEDMARHAAFHGESDAHRRQKANTESAPARCLMHESARLRTDAPLHRRKCQGRSASGSSCSRMQWSCMSPARWL